jgi:hypothetical protein
MSWFDLFTEKKTEDDFEIEHLLLGTLVYESEGWWKGSKVINGNEIEYFVDGSEFGINSVLADDCAEVLSEFSRYYQNALDILNKTVEEIGINQHVVFIPIDLALFWRKEDQKGFSMHFKDSNRGDLLWRVDFENLQAKYAGCDT